MQNIQFDPRAFISPPYIKCPKCGNNSFGVLIINDHQYLRRCKVCFYDENFPLPKLNKRIIYIDQFAISNMMKMLNPQTKAYKRGKVDKFWYTLFERLDSLCKLQLAICPDSGFHTDESLLSPYFKALKQMYELLSHGATFYNPETIKKFQICEHAKNWINGKENKRLNLNPNSVIFGEINAWQDRFVMSLDWEDNQDLVNDIRQMRAKKHEGLSEIFQRWKTDKDKNFDDWFMEESMDFGRITLQMYFNYIKRLLEGRTDFTTSDISLPSSVELIYSIKDIFKSNGLEESEIMSRIVDYLNLRSLKDIPFIKIASMLYAALARKAASGRKKPPNQGMANDIEILSVLLPYCDAMFIDNECHSFLKEKPLSDVIDYETKIFSLNNKIEFMGYLKEIEMNVSKEHLEKINEVYGETWGHPYITLYGKDKK